MVSVPGVTMELEDEQSDGLSWRSNGAMFVVMKSVADIDRYLGSLLRETRRTNPLLDEHYEKHGDNFESEAALEEFSDHMAKTWQLENSIRCAADTAILMAAIDLESTINQFCFYNLGERVADAIENLSLTAKLEVAHSAMGLGVFKGTRPYELVRALVVWRNAFAHGKNTDMPVRSLRENHLSRPGYGGPRVEREVGGVVRLVGGYIAADRYLSSVGQHEATNFYKLDLDDIEGWVNRMKSYQFEGSFIIGKSRIMFHPIGRKPFVR